ncbi:hypothetical protein MTO96_009493 [Rhipicephalus appendiculatus]
MIFSISTNGDALPRRADQAPVPGQDDGSAPTTRTNNARNGSNRCRGTRGPISRTRRRAARAACPWTPPAAPRC